MKTSEEKLIDAAVQHLRDHSFVQDLRGEICACCATQHVRGFHMYEHQFGGIARTTKEQKEALLSAGERILKCHMKTAEEMGKSLLVATINSKQLMAEELLERLGFVSSGWATRNPKHSMYRSKVKLYVKHLYTPEEEV